MIQTTPGRMVATPGALANGARWLPRALVDAALDREAERRRARGVADVTLTAREREIAGLVATGLSNKDIARTIGISDGTVRIHLSNIYQKLGVSNRTALATHASLEGQPGPIPASGER
jgi:DNA-binding NarL/FixJ family response regulator